MKDRKEGEVMQLCDKCARESEYNFAFGGYPQLSSAKCEKCRKTRVAYRIILSKKEADHDQDK